MSPEDVTAGRSRCHLQLVGPAVEQPPQLRLSENSAQGVARSPVNPLAPSENPNRCCRRTCATRGVAAQVMTQIKG